MLHVVAPEPQIWFQHWSLTWLVESLGQGYEANETELRQKLDMHVGKRGTQAAIKGSAPSTLVTGQANPDHRVWGLRKNGLVQFEGNMPK